jgi:hypothetical protein
MNELIEKLAEQATTRKFDGTGTDMGKLVLDQEKFAELIVRECIGIVEKQRARMSYGPTFVIVDIKQHFGVEE